jgi:hypothetical protein
MLTVLNLIVLSRLRPPLLLTDGYSLHPGQLPLERYWQFGYRPFRIGRG